MLPWMPPVVVFSGDHGLAVAAVDEHQQRLERLAPVGFGKIDWLS